MLIIDWSEVEVLNPYEDYFGIVEFADGEKLYLIPPQEVIDQMVSEGILPVRKVVLEGCVRSKKNGRR